ncbi:MAG TPA: EVE domain-containing protein [Gemmatimonadaceae bacterium]|nr:EVE domain-containing protein [Gemmatimonadaceae bacterium]
MPRYWLLKTEPSTYSFADLEREGRTTWDGVTNPLALKNIAAMQPGDTALIYHTGSEKAAVGIARIVSAPYPDPEGHDPKLLVVDLVPVQRLQHPVTLLQIKADRTFAQHPLVRQGRLSVVPLTQVEWDRIQKLASSKP